ncbi:hypothetical protein AB1Y20_023486 [Prymnesium parvum]|uniref:Ribosome-assembly protein 3 C-terminal domain-containing protein n=1 Tax=Prymnesium parvum TaxID=97485 RepID=A0AB34JDF9_PRYPA
MAPKRLRPSDAPPGWAPVLHAFRELDARLTAAPDRPAPLRRALAASLQLHRDLSAAAHHQPQSAAGSRAPTPPHAAPPRPTPPHAGPLRSTPPKVPPRPLNPTCTPRRTPLAAPRAAEARAHRFCLEAVGPPEAHPEGWLRGELAHAPLYERVLATNQAATLHFLDALAAVDRSGAGDEAEWSGWGEHLPHGRPSLLDSADGEEVSDAEEAVHAADDSPAGGAADDGEERERFRELYMEILTEAVPDELEKLRQDHMDPRELAVLVDALEFGAETFDGPQRKLATQSYAGPHCWFTSQGGVEWPSSFTSQPRIPPKILQHSRLHGGLLDEDSDDNSADETTSEVPLVAAVRANRKMKIAQPQAKSKHQGAVGNEQAE